MIHLEDGPFALRMVPTFRGHVTPWKINMEPTNHPFGKENDLPSLHYYGTHVNLPGCKLPGCKPLVSFPEFWTLRIPKSFTRSAALE